MLFGARRYVLIALAEAEIKRVGEEATLCAAAAGDGGDEHDLVAVFELVGVAAKEADVFVVDVDVDEAAQLAVLVLDVLGERGELGVDLGEQAGEVGGGGVEGLLTFGVAGESGGKNDFDGHYLDISCGGIDSLRG
jgi:hypothetical protein